MSSIEDTNLAKFFADKNLVSTTAIMKCLKSTVFKTSYGSAPPTDDQMMALLLVAKQYNLNPFTKELYAFPDKSGGVVPFISVDGWIKFINSHPKVDGCTFQYSEKMDALPGAKKCPTWMECTLYRNDRKIPITVREYLSEVYIPQKGKQPGPWQTHTNRMLRHKTIIQCARVAVGFSGLYDPDEAVRIIEGQANEEIPITDTDEDKGIHLNKLKEKISAIGWSLEDACRKLRVARIEDMTNERIKKVIIYLDGKIKSD